MEKRLSGRVTEILDPIALTSVQPTIDEINRILTLYGFTNFKIVPTQEDANQYQIVRDNGEIAEPSLSEGEETFITFLYFMQLAKGGTTAENVTDDRILIIDDPISSLDSSVLFVVSTLIKDLIKDIKTGAGRVKQIILLTHNIYFHKEVAYINGRTAQDSDTHYWILRKVNNRSEAQPYYLLNPINTSYELLWRELFSNHRSKIVAQNIMRRIIESYFKLIGKYGDDDLILSFPTHEEQKICQSLICWINDGSHGVADDLYIENQDVIVEKYYEVFKGIFTYMKHGEHYEMMTKSLTVINAHVTA